MVFMRFRKYILAAAILGLVVLLGIGFLKGAIGSELFSTERILDEPEIHLPASAIFPVESRENSMRGQGLGLMGFAITNTMISSWLTSVVLVIVLVIGANRMRLVPGRFQSLVELIINGLVSFVEGVAGKAMSRKFFPVIATIFLFVLLNSWMALLPFYFSLGFNSSDHVNPEFVAQMDIGDQAHLHGVVANYTDSTLELEDGASFLLHDDEHIHVGEGVRLEAIMTKEGLFAEHVKSGDAPRVDLLRSAGTDVNMPLALALVAFVFVEFWGLRSLGFGYLGKFVRIRGLFRGPKQFFEGLIDFFVGILETLSEIIRVVSFTFRLFGNMLAGELLILVSTFLVPFIFVVPFYGLEIFFGFIQAMIFAGLTLTFATVAISQHHE